ncbi:CMAS [Lepeophtheirus salmonis]|uniref:CMAS n=1 Tax=Lepeophtheirus salmonis TaxID=72036 RepID=A0A7R8D5C9_LEPSM|nr:CMAS [Lepeophtheirus salmonis]CAF3003736.1 CMAS [Lepeophtheirus salmonis]
MSCIEDNKKPHLAALILARGGSKGIPGKNIYPIAGKPLIIRSLEPAIACGKFDSIWVSTDDAKIAEVARSAGSKVQVFDRSPENATDESSSIDAVNEFLVAHKEVDIVGLIQCTSPFIQESFLERACNLITSDKYDSVFAVTRDKKFRWVDDEECIFPLNFRPKQRKRRQDMTGELVENGMFYFTKREFIEKGYIQGGRMFYVEIPPEYSIEIDSAFDMFLTETMIQNEKK